MSAMNPVGFSVAWLGRVVGIVGLSLAAMAPSARAGLLMDDTSNPLRGIISDVSPPGDDSWYFTADLEYAVYYGSCPPINKAFPGLYIYAYQLFNSGDSMCALDTFSMGIRRNEGVGNVGYYDPYGDACLPTNSGDATNPSSVIWQFSSNSMFYPSKVIDLGEHSPILYFTSPFGPGHGSATIDGGMPADISQNIGPYSPSPEPATGGLLIAGALVLLTGGVVRRIRGGKRAILQDETNRADE